MSRIDPSSVYQERDQRDKVGKVRNSKKELLGSTCYDVVVAKHILREILDVASSGGDDEVAPHQIANAAEAGVFQARAPAVRRKGNRILGCRSLPLRQLRRCASMPVSMDSANDTRPVTPPRDTDIDELARSFQFLSTPSNKMGSSSHASSGGFTDLK